MYTQEGERNGETFTGGHHPFHQCALVLCEGC
jgi:hypothetical protein